MDSWVAIVEVKPFRLWRDVPAANGLTLACTAAELAAWIDTLPGGCSDSTRRYGALLAEVRARSRDNDGATPEAARMLRVYMTVVAPETSPGQVHTGTGEGAWLHAGDELRLVRFDDERS